ncbi:toll/interleukin-1 receptor domain-containing protein [Nodosilinea sp. LEGE 06152]|uniref:toll/interleukin-1 receptor domain-containing protein n=1 Tax=Nodosilinea sp. LEGE 06152 TaxID=2777966 RepID=UPI0018823505|nr:toll/interleukin-1 receptor domain-containing protein [Nodosilinea sp. LEGE 06152]MBE9156843.1 toll/interleukin-1 receptor domain-containing protein [Nodosilinea sp. LEGE 06152]
MKKYGKIFISYRRTDSPSESERIYERLSQEFGEDNVYKDVYSIAAGSDYREDIKNALEQCDVLIVVIGKDWLTVLETGKKMRRLDNPKDWVRLEVETALERKIVIIPVLVGGADLPQIHELPNNLKKLIYFNSAKIREYQDFKRDMEDLIKSIKSHFSSKGLTFSDSQKPKDNQNTEAVQVAFRPPKLKKKESTTTSDKVLCFVFTVLAFAFPVIASNLFMDIFGFLFFIVIATMCVYEKEGR